MPDVESDALAAVLRKHRADGWVCTCGWPLTDSVGSVVDYLAEQIEPLIAARVEAAKAEAWDEGYAACYDDLDAEAGS